jgi:dTDP-4-amino-4,6-dideoxygalactose transaminase
VYSFAKKNNLRVIEDAAHSFGGKYNDKPVGSFGDVVCFSFDPVKSVTCGEGGAVVSDDIYLMQKVKEMRLLGMNKKNGFSSTKVCSNMGVSERGWRYHMNNINASIGLVQLRKLNQFAAIRRHLIAEYVHLLKNIKYIELLPYDYEKIGHYIFVVRLKDVESEVVIQEMKNRGIECGNHYYPPHLNPYFRKFYPYPLPAVEKIYKTLLTLPLHTGLTEKDIHTVVENLEEILENNAGIKEVMSGKTKSPIS